MPRILFTVQYRGTRYAGWQRQKNAVAIQQVLEEALAQMFGAAVHTEAAGRTDAGVHAEAQSVHADLPATVSERGLVLGLNNLLPKDIRIREAKEVNPHFHCRFDATGKTYRYAIWNALVSDAFLHETHAHVPGFLDAARMQEAAEPLVGHHDFRSFTVARPEVSSTWRTVESLQVRREGERLLIEVSADGFLRYMVRRIAGILIEIGRGALPPERAGAALEPHFQEARWTAPAEGLTLVSIRFGGMAEGSKSLC